MGIGERLFANCLWKNIDPFHTDIDVRYDFVIANPPFGKTAGMGTAKDWSGNTISNSEHLFLALAGARLKPGGKALFIAPENFLDRIPRKGVEFISQYINLDTAKRSFVLDGEFQFTSIRVHAFIFEGAR